MNTETKYEHPGEWLPGDQIIDRDGGLCERGGDGKWRWYLHRDGRAYVEQRTNAGWTDEMVDSELALPGTRIVRLVPRDEPTDQPPTLPDTSSWVRRAPGDVIEAGTPYVVAFADRLTVAEPRDLPFTVSAEVTKVCTYWTPPPAPSEPWSVISTDRDKPTLARVTLKDCSPMDGSWWRHADYGQLLVADTDFTWADLKDIESVELLHTHSPETHVPVERALIDEAALYAETTADTLTAAGFMTASELVRSLASLASDESSASDGGRS